MLAGTAANLRTHIEALEWSDAMVRGEHKEVVMGTTKILIV
jgi:hypothetical protein